MSPWLHLLPPPRAPPGRRTQTFGSTFTFGGRRAFQPPRCNNDALPPPRGRGGPLKPHHTPCHLPAPFIDPPLRAQADHAASLLRRPPRCKSGAQPPPRGRGGPSKPLSTSLHPPSALFDPRRPTAANDGDAVVASATAVRRRLSAPTTALPRPRGAPGSLSTSPHPPSAVFDPRRPTAANDSHAVQRWPRHKSAKASGGLSPPPCTLPRPSSTCAGPRRRMTATWCNDAPRQVFQGPGGLSPPPCASLGPF
ncbi:hypothetical protein BKA93DRAFT_827918 [Sparassis latifolia]